MAFDLNGLSYVRSRLRDMINGDDSVDIASLMHLLDKKIQALGGQSLTFKPHEYKSVFFSMLND